MTQDQIEQLKQDALAIDAIRKRFDILSRSLLVQKLAVEAKQDKATSEEIGHWDYARLAYPPMERASRDLFKAFRESFEAFNIATAATSQGEIMANPPSIRSSAPHTNWCDQEPSETEWDEWKNS